MWASLRQPPVRQVPRGSLSDGPATDAAHRLTCFAEQLPPRLAHGPARIYSSGARRGCRHPHAIRILGRAWLRVLWRAWQDRKPIRSGPARCCQRHRLTQAVSRPLLNFMTGIPSVEALSARFLLDARCPGRRDAHGQEHPGMASLRLKGAGALACLASPGFEGHLRHAAGLGPFGGDELLSPFGYRRAEGTCSGILVRKPGQA